MTDQAPKPVPTFYGHPITPKLTKEQEARAIELFAEGMSIKKVATTLQVGENRVRTLRDKRKTAEAQALFQATKNTPAALNNLQEGLNKVISILDQLVTNEAAQNTEIRKMNKALFRRSTENKRLRETVAQQKADLRDLKRFYHGKTGREWL
ncbi:hypothetical protein [Caulobacter sp. FWC2]|uniref:hypothetical protein n=1 Tax=Caulobacter sp. FWC2 TaxID=69664 RepID=UPI001177357C|nr:hypothetical protein [Caulobacter sp. FWC2]